MRIVLSLGLLLSISPIFGMQQLARKGNQLARTAVRSNLLSPSTAARRTPLFRKTNPNPAFIHFYSSMEKEKQKTKPPLAEIIENKKNLEKKLEINRSDLKFQKVMMALNRWTALSGSCCVGMTLVGMGIQSPLHTLFGLGLTSCGILFEYDFYKKSVNTNLEIQSLTNEIENTEADLKEKLEKLD